MKNEQKNLNFLTLKTNSANTEERDRGFKSNARDTTFSMRLQLNQTMKSLPKRLLL